MEGCYAEGAGESTVSIVATLGMLTMTIIVHVGGVMPTTTVIMLTYITCVDPESLETSL